MEKKKDKVVEKWDKFGMLRGLDDDIKVFVAHTFEDIEGNIAIYMTDDCIPNNWLKYAAYPIVYRIYKEGHITQQISKDALCNIFGSITVNEVIKHELKMYGTHDPILASLIREKTINQLLNSEFKNIDVEAAFTSILSNLAIKKIKEEIEK